MKKTYVNKESLSKSWKIALLRLWNEILEFFTKDLSKLFWKHFALSYSEESFHFGEAFFCYSKDCLGYSGVIISAQLYFNKTIMIFKFRVGLTNNQ